MKATLVMVIAALSLSACASTAATQRVPNTSADVAAECDRRARDLTTFGVAAPPFTTHPWTGASQWVRAFDSASVDQMLRHHEYRRCLADMGRGLSGLAR